MSNIKGLHKHGNYWQVCKTITIDGVTKRKWFDLGVKYSEATRPQAEKKYKERFGTRAKYKDTLQKLE